MASSPTSKTGKKKKKVLKTAPGVNPRAPSFVPQYGPVLSAESIAKQIASDPYDLKIMSSLESYVILQAGNGSYDFEANRHLLMLYSFYPELVKMDVLAQLLTKALMALPQTDFLACTYLVPLKHHELEPVKTLLMLSSLLETGQFRKFWKERNVLVVRALLEPVVGFDEAIRAFIITTLTATYRAVSVSAFKELVNLPDKGLKELLAKHSLRLTEGEQTVVFPQQAAGGGAAVAPAAASSAGGAAPAAGDAQEGQARSDGYMTLEQICKLMECFADQR